MRFFQRPAALCLTLLVASAIPIITSGVLLSQLMLGELPPDSVRYANVPVSFAAHTAGGIAFALIGPIQFARVLRRRFGWLHRFLGRIFALAGLGLGGTGMALLLYFPSSASLLISGARGLGSVALVLSVVLGVMAARAGRIAAHRAWMIRAYAVGMGATAAAPVLLPIYLIRGEVGGTLTDVVFIGSWVACIAFAERVIRRPRREGGGPTGLPASARWAGSANQSAEV